MHIPQQLQQALAAWDGRHPAPLREFADRKGDEPGFMGMLLEVYQGAPAWQVPITWLLKHRVESGERLLSPAWSAVLTGGQHLTHWEARVHILQLIPRLGLTRADAERVVGWIFDSLEAENTFERAAAFAAYHIVVQQIPGLKQEFLAICTEAMERERASVKVSIKRILRAEGIRL